MLAAESFTGEKIANSGISSSTERSARWCVS
jgi:hypothetical protein